MLIRNAELWGAGLADVRLAGGRIAAIGQLLAAPGERVLDARGGALLPGLCDQHLHLMAFAAARQSVPCGPPHVRDAEQLAARLGAMGSGWLRGTGYHEMVAGLPDRHLLDAMAPDRPVRIQHRSGRMWFLNSRALDLLLAAAPAPEGLERAGGHPTGRLFDADGWLRQALGNTLPDVAAASRELTALGITGIADMSPDNGPETAALMAAMQADGRLGQRLLLAGNAALDTLSPGAWLAAGPLKLHLHEAALPTLETVADAVRGAHRAGRAVAFHAATEVELLFALAALDDAGPSPGDRIEHASVAPDHAVEHVARLGLIVVTQPAFIAAKGDQYRADVPRADWPHLYRLGSWLRRGVALAGSSDAPFGPADPWAAMAAAVSRQTETGAVIGAEEALSPEQALAMYLADPADCTTPRRIAVGAQADLCLLDRSWGAARDHLHAGLVRATLIDGLVRHERIDEAPGQRGARAQAFA